MAIDITIDFTPFVFCSLSGFAFTLVFAYVVARQMGEMSHLGAATLALLLAPVVATLVFVAMWVILLG